MLSKDDQDFIIKTYNSVREEFTTFPSACSRDNGNAFHKVNRLALGKPPVRLSGVASLPVISEFVVYFVEKLPAIAGEARFILNGFERTAPVVFGDKGVYLLGAVTLETMGLIIDPINRKLEPLRARARLNQITYPSKITRAKAP